MRIIFFGTPAYSVGFLHSLISAGMKPITVVSQPDRPIGREKVIVATPTKELALANHIPVLQPEDVNDPTFISALKQLTPDLIIVVSFGQIISQDVINIPKYGCINVHPSLLPALRGATPLQSAILQGLSETGITIMLMDEKMDHGPLLAQKHIPISMDETYISLTEKTIDQGRSLLVDTIQDFVDGKITPQTQDHEKATFTKMLKKETGKVTGEKSITEVRRMLRALYPWPGLWCEYNGKRIKIHSIGEDTITDPPHPPGTLFTLPDYPHSLWYQLSNGSIELVTVQPEGKNNMSGEEFARGYLRPESQF
ncbi:MAG: methionyl-tRNA formyltransferase [bacterium]|nr:methionyl-tRNA formyltransferase [bacterium]